MLSTAYEAKGRTFESCRAHFSFNRLEPSGRWLSLFVPTLTPTLGNQGKKIIMFADEKHIEQIRKRLWYGREFGQAAVMVGAGFSRNADRISLSIPPFPLWYEVASQFFDALYPPGSLPEPYRQANKARMTAGNGPLKLALEYEEEFGRLALDDLLLQTIPDDRYVPGHLHRLLLSLPWSDIFTTNYDTLLERSRPSIHDRKYDLILNSQVG